MVQARQKKIVFSRRNKRVKIKMPENIPLMYVLIYPTNSCFCSHLNKRGKKSQFIRMRKNFERKHS